MKSVRAIFLGYLLVILLGVAYAIALALMHR